MGHEQHANSLSHTISIMNPMTSFWLTGSRRHVASSAKRKTELSSKARP